MQPTINSRSLIVGALAKKPHTVNGWVHIPPVPINVFKTSGTKLGGLRGKSHI